MYLNSADNNILIDHTSQWHRVRETQTPQREERKERYDRAHA